MNKTKCFLLEPTESFKDISYTLSNGATGVNQHRLYKRQDTSELLTLKEIPVGGIYRAGWYEEYIGKEMLSGPDKESWVCVISGSYHWLIDGRASNCTMKDDTKHNCWCRHGNAPDFTVNKNGITCAAGAGSIVAPDGWHGYLRNGFLEL